MSLLYHSVFCAYLEYFVGNEGSAPKEGRDEVRRMTNNAPSLSKTKADPYARYRKHLDRKELTEEEKEAVAKEAASFSALNHVFTFNELEFVVIVLILVVFVSSLLWQIYTGRFKIPSFRMPSLFGFMNKRPGGRYSN